MTFAHKLHQKIKSLENKVAISIGDKNITYKYLNSISKKIGKLFSENIPKSSVVGIVGQRNFSVYFGILGSIYSGCTYVPINEKYTEDRVLRIIKEARINVLIGNKKSISLIQKTIISTNIKVILFPEEEFSSEINIFPKNIRCFYKSDLSSLKSIEPKKILPSHVFYILFTSGSTGNPKGVMVTDENIDSFIQNMSSFYKLPIGYRSSQTFDLSFDLSVVDTFFTWINGGQLCVLNQSELLMPFNYLKREKINFWFSVPTLANFMFKMGYLKPNSFPDLKYSLFCGEALPKNLSDVWQKASQNSSIENYYGPTEATVSITRFLYKKEFINRKFINDILPIGKIFNEHSFAVVNEKLNRVKKGEQGQLIIKGKQISKGYINNLENTKKVFTKIPWDETNQIWYLTGDLVSLNDYEEIEFLGRIDNQIKIAGRRVEIGEIESALLKSSILKDIVVTPKKDRDGSVKSLIGFTTTNISEAEKTYIYQSALKFIEKLFIPSKILFVKKMPLTNSGKTDRKKLFELAQEI